MPALSTHRLFGEESMNLLPAGIVSTEDERLAFLLGNQGPDPFFFRMRTPETRSCTEFGRRMHRCRMTRQFATLREGVGRLVPADAGVGRCVPDGPLTGMFASLRIAMFHTTRIKAWRACVWRGTLLTARMEEAATGHNGERRLETPRGRGACGGVNGGAVCQHSVRIACLARRA